MNASPIINILADKPVAYHPDLARIFGGVKSAVLLCQLLYWTGKGAREDGFIWKTQVDITQETGLSRSEQETARHHLLEAGVLEEKLAGIPAKLHYRLDIGKLQERVQEYYERDHRELAGEEAETLQTRAQKSNEQDCGKVADKNEGNQQASMQETSKQVCGNPTSKAAGNLQSNTENTTETTIEHTETTTENVNANASTPVAEKKQAAESPLIPDTPASQLLFKKLVLNAAAKHRRGPGRFPTLECKINFDQAAKLLDGEFDEVLNKALKQGITSVVGVTNYIAKWASNMQKKGKPQVIQVGN